MPSPAAAPTPAPRPPQPRQPTKTLHFFPGPRQMIWVEPGRPHLRVDAWGGEEPVPGQAYAVMPPQPTTPGAYVVHSYAPYRTNTWANSKSPWGAPLQLDGTGQHLLYQSGSGGGAWRRVESIIPHATVAWVRQEYRSLFGASTRYDLNLDGIPDTWVFNDFGAMAVRYFKDVNGNRRLDGREALSGEMIHTTPPNEGEAAQGLPVQLMPSHGCIHVTPAGRDLLHSRGAFTRGTPLWIHAYSEPVPAVLP